MNRFMKLSRLLFAACLPLSALLCAYTLHSPKVNAFAGASLAAPSVRAQTQLPAVPLETKLQSGQTFGLYRAVVISGPDAHMRVRVKIPALNISAEWASPCFPVGSTTVPPPQSQVWIMFEQGNTHLPVWIGVLTTRAAG
jgi:Type VI secretion system/phage-baseplate injector OB domain